MYKGNPSVSPRCHPHAHAQLPALGREGPLLCVVANGERMGKEGALEDGTAEIGEGIPRMPERDFWFVPGTILPKKEPP